MLTLRPTTADDLPFVLACEQDPEAGPYISGWTHARHLAALADPDCVHSILVADADGRALGFALVFGATSPNHCIELRRLVCRERGRGFGRAAVRAVKALAFGRLAAHRLWLDVQLRNARARALYRSEGFIEEGVMRECVLVDGVYLSMALMSLLRQEYPGGATLPG